MRIRPRNFLLACVLLEVVLISVLTFLPDSGASKYLLGWIWALVVIPAFFFYVLIDYMIKKSPGNEKDKE